MFSSLRQTISLASTIGIVLTLVLVLVITQLKSTSVFNDVGNQVKQQLQTEAKAKLEATAIQQSLLVEQLVLPVLANLNQLQAVLERVAKLQPSAQQVSDVFYDTMVAQDEAVFAGYMVWETPVWNLNKGDGINDSGVLAPFYSPKPEGGFDVIAMNSFANSDLNDNGERIDEWHLAPFESGQTFVMEPYYYDVRGTQTLITTISSPIKVDGKILGSFGFDLSLAVLQQQSQNLSASLFDGQGAVALLSSKGVYLSDSKNPANLGKKLDYAQSSNWSQVQQAINRNQTLILEEGDIYQAFVPVNTGGAPWVVRVDVPKAHILQASNRFQDWLSDESMSLLIGGVITGIGAIFFGFLFMWFVAGKTSSKLELLVERFREVAEGDGDLTYRLDETGKDETAQLAHWFNNFLTTLRDTLQRVEEITRNIDVSAHESSEKAQEASKGMALQQTEVNSIATAMNEMTSTASDVAGSASQTVDTANQVQQSSARGSVEMKQAADSVESLAAQINDTEQQVSELAASSQNIDAILEVIVNIAGQTNMLALNAAIEAARAGVYGKGFSVVADEVRSLASKTKASTEDVREMLENLKGGTGAIASLMQATQQQAVQSVEFCNSAEITFNDINESIDTVSSMNTQISHAAAEQSTAAEDINRNVLSISGISTQVSEGASEAVQISKDLVYKVEELRAEISRFKL